MKNLIETIDILFSKSNPNKVIKNFLKSRNLESPQLDMHFESMFSSVLPGNYSLDEIENLKYRLDNEWGKHGIEKNESKQSENYHIFNLLGYMTKEKGILIEEYGYPIVNYKNLTEWRTLSLNLGEDVLTTAFFAYNDKMRRTDRFIFDWEPIIKDNNHVLKDLFSRGLAENHYHLYGSAPIAEISWAALMNNPSGFSDSFRSLDKRKGRMNPRVSIDFEESQDSLETLVKKAAIIRVLLYQVVYQFEEHFKDDKKKMDKINEICDILESKSETEINFWTFKMKDEIEALKYVNLNNLNVEVEIYDYAIRNYSACKSNTKYKGNIVFSGERELLYKFFRGLYEGEEQYIEFFELFYAYILIWNTFRSELIQLNKKVGFKNFQIYQNDKFAFIRENSIYYKVAVNLATKGTVENQGIKYLEARITPKQSSHILSRTVRELDKIIVDKAFFNDNIFERNGNFPYEKVGQNDTYEYEKSIFYNIHFIKNKESIKISRNMGKEYCEYQESLIPRNHNLREKIKKETLEFIKFKEQGTEVSNRILGIDAASSEIGCRPEVFAQAFRMIRNYEIDQEREFVCFEPYVKPGISYHAGEDFFDIVDGLRAIDESIKFLRLDQGDRIGHALALGINARDYYNSKNNILVMPIQDLLDNCVWLYNQMRKFNINNSQVEMFLEKKFVSLFRIIYGHVKVKTEDSEQIIAPCIHSYYDSWKLRGDNPKMIQSLVEKYKEYQEYEKCSNFTVRELKMKFGYTKWDYYGYGILDEEDQRIYNDIKALKMYEAYHFDSDVKEKGKRTEEFKVVHSYIEVVAKIQKCIQEVIQAKNIAIETNPSSNFLIGTFKDYSKHPIFDWNNMGLASSYDEFRLNPQMNVSINTDDQGVFNTYLEREYSLLAQALERKVDEHGQPLYKQSMIYEWLENIRKMGIQQSFIHRLNSRKEKRERDYM